MPKRQNGKCIRESTGLADYQAARQKLNQRLGKIASGEVVDLQSERVSVKQLADDMIRDYRINGKRALRMLRRVGDSILSRYSAICEQCT